MDDGLKQALLSGLRSILISAGTWLAAKGYIESGQVEIIVGAVLAIGAAAIGVWQKYSAERKAKERETVAVQVGVDAKAEGMVARTVTPERAQSLIKTMAPEKGTAP